MILRRTRWQFTSFVLITCLFFGMLPTSLATLNELLPIEQQAYLKAANIEFFAQFGTSVATDGDILVVGAPRETVNNLGEAGAVYVFERNLDDSWSQTAYITASNADIQDHFGATVAIDGATLAVGAPNEDSPTIDPSVNAISNSGAVYVFEQQNGSWSQQALLKASNLEQDDQFGYSLALRNGTLIVGAPFEDGNGEYPSNNDLANAGAAYLFVNNGTTWTEQAYLKAPNPDDSDQFGWSVAADGATALVGAPFEDGDGTSQADNSAANAGATYVFTATNGLWSSAAYLKAAVLDPEDRFGWSVDLEANLAAISAVGEASNSATDPLDDSLLFAGAVYVFEYADTAWSQQAYLKAANPDIGDYFGQQVALAGSYLAIGAHQERGSGTGINPPPNNNFFNAGAVYLFVQDASTPAWQQQTYLKASNTGNGDLFGSTIALNADQLVVGAPGEDSNSTSNPANNDENESGAVYVFSQLNLAPVANAGPDQTVETLEMVTLDASGSSDPDNDELSYLWQQSGGPSVALSSTMGITTTFVAPDDPTVLTWTLTITDTGGLTATDTVVITVTNQAPVADAGADQTVESAALVQLDGSGSYDPDNDTPLSYQWSQISGPNVVLSAPNTISPTFSAPIGPAELIFELTVTDSFGLSNTQTTTVTINVLAPPEYRIYLPIVRR